jgi:3'-5' exoribonuclease
MNHNINDLKAARSHFQLAVDWLARYSSKTAVDLCQAALTMPGYFDIPASISGHHHTANGGHAIHTAQVLEIALGMVKEIPGAKRAEMIVAILWHDIGKLCSYEPAPVPPDRWQKTRNYDLIGHLPTSALMFQEACPTHSGLDTKLIQHIILSHHGRNEWGSPVVPKTPEAWAVHAADMMSSQFLKEEPRGNV